LIVAPGATVVSVSFVLQKIFLRMQRNGAVGRLRSLRRLVGRRIGVFAAENDQRSHQRKGERHVSHAG
jgi:hypothetical protein